MNRQWQTTLSYGSKQGLPPSGELKGALNDPMLGRMLSPDPVVQSPGNLQNYNRYSYCLNNPLKYTDPTGYQVNRPTFDAFGYPTQDSRNNSDYVGSSSGGGGGGWYNTYRNAVLDGYTSGMSNFLEAYYRQLNSPNFDGTFKYFTNLNYVDENKKIMVTSTKHEIKTGAASGGDVYTYRIYGNDISISNSIEIGSTRLTRNALYIYDKEGVLSAVSSQGIPYRGKDIIKFMVQQKVNSTNSWEALSKLFQNEIYNGPYSGEYKGLGNGGSALGLPHEGGLWLMDYLNWIQNNPEEVNKMQTEYYYFLKKIQGE